MLYQAWVRARKNWLAGTCTWKKDMPRTLSPSPPTRWWFKHKSSDEVRRYSATSSVLVHKSTSVAQGSVWVSMEVDVDWGGG